MPIKLHPTPTTIMGCYYCFNLFRKEEVHTYHDDGKTPECPCCGIDSVLEFSTCMGIGDILINLSEKAEVAWSIVDIPKEDKLINGTSWFDIVEGGVYETD